MSSSNNKNTRHLSSKIWYIGHRSIDYSQVPMIIDWVYQQQGPVWVGYLIGVIVVAIWMYLRVSMAWTPISRVKVVIEIRLYQSIAIISHRK